MVGDVVVTCLGFGVSVGLVWYRFYWFGGGFGPLGFGCGGGGFSSSCALVGGFRFGLWVICALGCLFWIWVRRW